MAKEIVAMILAGGRGSRLYALTQKTAKPAVGFGGKYRIVDFPLSNCVNSNIDTVGIATQYQPQKLNEYIGNGQPWDLDRLYGGVHTLPPYEQAKGTDWYKGTATPSTRTSASSTAMILSTSSSCPVTRSASRTTPTSCASTRKRARSSPWLSWRSIGRKLPALA